MDGLNGVEVLGSCVLYKGLLKFLKVAEVVGVIVESTSPHWEEGSKDCNGRGYRVERIFGHFRAELRESHRLKREAGVFSSPPLRTRTGAVK